MQRLIGLQGPLRHRLRLRHRSRPPRHRHRRAPGCCRPIIICRSRSTTCSASAAWSAQAAVGKTVVSSAHDRPRRGAPRAPAVRGAGRLQMVRRRACSTAPRLRRRGKRGRARSCAATARAWTTDKDGIIAGACWPPKSPPATGRDPGERYRGADARLGEPFADRVEAPATPRAEEAARQARPPQMQIRRPRRRADHRACSTQAPGNGAPIGGIKVVRAERLVRGATLRHRGHLQDLRRELPSERPSAADL